MRVVDLVQRGLRAPWWFYFQQYLLQAVGWNAPDFHVLDVFVEACEGRIQIVQPNDLTSNLWHLLFEEALRPHLLTNPI